MSASGGAKKATTRSDVNKLKTSFENALTREEFDKRFKKIKKEGKGAIFANSPKRGEGKKRAAFRSDKFEPEEREARTKFYKDTVSNIFHRQYVLQMLEFFKQTQNAYEVVENAKSKFNNISLPNANELIKNIDNAMAQLKGMYEKQQEAAKKANASQQIKANAAMIKQQFDILKDEKEQAQADLRADREILIQEAQETPRDYIRRYFKKSFLKYESEFDTGMQGDLKKHNQNRPYGTPKLSLGKFKLPESRNFEDITGEFSLYNRKDASGKPSGRMFNGGIMAELDAAALRIVSEQGVFNPVEYKRFLEETYLAKAQNFYELLSGESFPELTPEQLGVSQSLPFLGDGYDVEVVNMVKHLFNRVPDYTEISPQKKIDLLFDKGESDKAITQFQKRLLGYDVEEFQNTFERAFKELSPAQLKQIADQKRKDAARIKKQRAKARKAAQAEIDANLAAKEERRAKAAGAESAAAARKAQKEQEDIDRGIAEEILRRERQEFEDEGIAEALIRDKALRKEEADIAAETARRTELNKRAKAMAEKDVLKRRPEKTEFESEEFESLYKRHLNSAKQNAARLVEEREAAANKKKEQAAAKAEQARLKREERERKEAAAKTERERQQRIQDLSTTVYQRFTGDRGGFAGRGGKEVRAQLSSDAINDIVTGKQEARAIGEIQFALLHPELRTVEMNNFFDRLTGFEGGGAAPKPNPLDFLRGETGLQLDAQPAAAAQQFQEPPEYRARSLAQNLFQSAVDTDKYKRQLQNNTFQMDKGTGINPRTGGQGLLPIFRGDQFVRGAGGTPDVEVAATGFVRDAAGNIRREIGSIQMPQVPRGDAYPRYGSKIQTGTTVESETNLLAGFDPTAPQPAANPTRRLEVQAAQRINVGQQPFDVFHQIGNIPRGAVLQYRNPLRGAPLVSPTGERLTLGAEVLGRDYGGERRTLTGAQTMDNTVASMGLSRVGGAVGVPRTGGGDAGLRVLAEGTRDFGSGFRKGTAVSVQRPDADFRVVRSGSGAYHLLTDDIGLTIQP